MDASNDQLGALPLGDATGQRSRPPGDIEELRFDIGSSEVSEAGGPELALCSFLSAVGLSDSSTAARSLLQQFGSISDMLAAPPRRLKQCVGDRLSRIITASRFLIRTSLLETIERAPLVPRSAGLIDLLQLEIGFLKEEVLLAIFVDAGTRLMSIERIAEGGPRSINIDHRKIISRGLAVGAAGFILVHNHPSGIPEPSKADLDTTNRLRLLSAELDLHLLDHLIIARGRFGSIEDFWREARYAACSDQPF